jgi:Protein of unknown function (DUF3500)
MAFIRIIFLLIFSGSFYACVKSSSAAVSPDPTVTTPPVNAACDALVGPAAKVACLADAFKATLTSSQITSLQIALNKTNAVKWTNLPGGLRGRNGLEFSTLSAAQVLAAKAVIQAAAGTTEEEGYSEFLQINAADEYLGLKQSGYSDDLYIIAFLGVPSATGTWMLQFGGHHYAQNITYAAGKVVSTTPSHQGVEPLSYITNSKTYNPLKNDHAGMVRMLAGFTETQLTAAKLSAKFGDLLLGAGKDGQFPATKLGVKVSSLSMSQKALVLAAMKPWTQDVDDATGVSMLSIYEKELDDTYVSFSGSASLSNNADYVRIDGPSVWIELVCQGGVVYSGIHYHAIYRDHARDYNGL